MDNINVDNLASDWLDIKADEKALIAKRHAIEEQIAAALEVKDEGSISHKLDGHKVTLTQPVSRKVDAIEKNTPTFAASQTHNQRGCRWLSLPVG